MDSKRELAIVGSFVVVAALLLVVTVFIVAGFLHRGDVPYRAYFASAGGLEAGSAVRYRDGQQVGRVEEVHSDPSDPTRLEVRFRVSPETPVKTDSIAKIASVSPLGQNFLDIISPNRSSPPAPPGSILKSEEYAGLESLSAKIGALEPEAELVLKNVNSRVTELHTTIDSLNQMVGPRNRANISASLDNIRGMLEEDRPKIRTTLTNFNSASAKLLPLIDQFQKTVLQADKAIAQVNATLLETRPELRQSLADLRGTLASADALVEQLDRTLTYNSENIDEILENMNHVSENLRAFTETIKTRPYTLLRSSSPPPRVPGEGPK